MSTTVDNRIVEMQFDNREFEINANASIKTLDKLKDALDMDDAARGFQEIDGAAKNIDMNPLMSAVQSVGEKFSAMDVVAVTALSRITNAAIDAGKRLISSLSVDQVTAGWAKYADMTSSIQTIMGATAKDIGKKDEQGNIIGYLNVEDQMEKVSAQLEKLATYADETSYSLTDMTNNVGKFTSMNIPLNESVKAMQGIANWAAISGANSAQASRAMYNLSQALGMGSVRVQDWMSIENANMATYEFKEMVIAEAIAQGKLTKEGKTFGKNTEKTVKVINELTGELEFVKQTTEATAVTAENFRSTLAEGWFDTDVLNAVLSKYGSFSVKMLDYADELGGTATEWLEAIDDFNDANGEFNLDEFMAKLNDDVDAEKVIEVLKELGSAEYELGRKAFKAAQEAKTFQEAIDATKDAVSSKFMKIFEYIFGNYLEAKELWTDLAEALYNIFAEPLNDLSDMFKEWRENGGREALWEGVYNVWRNIAAVLGAVKEGFASVFPPKTAQDLLDVTNAFKAWSERMKPSAEQLARFKLIAEGVAKTIKGISTGFKMVGKIIGAVFNGIKKVFTKNNPVGELAESTEELVEVAKGPLLSLIDKFSDKMTELYKRLDNGTLLEDISNGVVFLADKIKSAVTTVKKTLDDWGVTDFLKKAKDDIVGFFKSFGKSSKVGDAAEESVNPLIKFGAAVKGFFAAIGGFFKNNFSLDKIKGFFENIKNFFVGVKDSFDKGSKDLSTSVKDFGSNVGDALTGAANKLSPAADFLKKVFGKIGEILTEFIDGLSLGKIVEYITSGVALKLLVDLGKLFSGIADFAKGLGKTMMALPKFLKRIGKGFKAIGDGVEEFGVGFKKIGKGVNKMGWAAMLKSFGLALLEFAAACFVVSLIPAEKIDQVMKLMITGFTGFAAVLMAAGLASKLGGGTGVSKMLGLAGIAVALGAVILKITTALKTVGELNPDQFAQGLYGVGAIIGLTALLIAVPMLLARQSSVGKKILNMDMTKVLNKATSGGDVNYKGLALSLAAAVYVVNKMVKSVETLGNLDEKSFSQGITGVAAIMGMTMLLMYIIGKTSQSTESSKNGNKTKSVTKNMKGIAKTFLALSIALGVVALAVKHISDVPLPNMATAVGALTILGGVITAIEVLVSKFGNGKGASSVAGIGFGLLLIAGALGLLAIPIVVLSKALDEMGDPTLIWSAVGALSALLAVISLAAGLLSKKAVGGLGVMGVAIGLTLMAVAITALTIPLLMLSNAIYDMDAETIWIAVGALSAIVAVVGVLAGVLSAFTIGGLGVMGVGAGLILIATSLLIMANALTMLANAQFDTEALLGATAALSLVVTLVGVLAGILSTFTLGGLGVVGVGAGLVVIAIAIQMLANTLTMLAATEPEALWTAVDALSELVKVIGVLAGILSLVTAGGLGVLGVGAGIILIAIGLTQLVKPMQDIAAMGDSAWDSMLKMAAMLGGLAVAGIIAPMVMLLGASLFVLGGGAAAAGAGLILLADGLNAIVEFIEDMATKISDFLTDAWEAITGFFEDFKNFWGINSPSTVMETMGGFLMQGLVNGIKGGADLVKKAVNWVGDKIKGFFNGIGDIFKSIGGGIMDKIGSGMEAVGEFMDGGLGKGIANAAGSIKDSVVGVATKTVDWFKGIFKIHSPSLVMEEMGGYVDQGLANGITKNTDVVNDATDTLGSGLIDKLKGYLSEKNLKLGFDGSLIDMIKEKLLSGGDLGDLSSMTSSISDIFGGQLDGMFDDVSDDFTITPVLDLSEVEAGMSDLTNMTDETSEMALNASSDFDSYDASRQNGMAVDNSNVIAAINTLRDEVGALSQFIGKLNIVMDTGALVGQLTVPMDEALGKQLVYGNRGM